MRERLTTAFNCCVEKIECLGSLGLWNRMRPSLYDGKKNTGIELLKT
jgi:hypothetical protein